MPKGTQNETTLDWRFGNFVTLVKDHEKKYNNYSLNVKLAALDFYKNSGNVSETAVTFKVDPQRIIPWECSAQIGRVLHIEDEKTITWWRSKGTIRRPAPKTEELDMHAKREKQSRIKKSYSTNGSWDA